jgi:hypothetical protein
MEDGSLDWSDSCPILEDACVSQAGKEQDDANMLSSYILLAIVQMEFDSSLVRHACYRVGLKQAICIIGGESPCSPVDGRARVLIEGLASAEIRDSETLFFASISPQNMHLHFQNRPSFAISVFF